VVPLFLNIIPFGIDPKGLKTNMPTTDSKLKSYADQSAYCIANPKNYYGIVPSAGDLRQEIYSGYTASSPDNDVSVITPTAAISSIGYTYWSMEALRYFYYKLGDRLWGY
jgi:hypothetical protein